MSINKIHKNSPFKVPKEYFGRFDATLFNEIELKTSFKETGFKTPDSYLNDFNISIPKISKFRSVALTLALTSALTSILAHAG